MMNKKGEDMTAIIERLTEVVYAFVENSYEFTDEGIGYDEACDILELTEEEKTAVLNFLDEEFRIV